MGQFSRAPKVWKEECDSRSTERLSDASQNSISIARERLGADRTLRETVDEFLPKRARRLFRSAGFYVPEGPRIPLRQRPYSLYRNTGMVWRMAYQASFERCTGRCIGLVESPLGRRQAVAFHPVGGQPYLQLRICLDIRER